MEKYGGRLIFTARDDDGLLEVVDTQGVRRLHFGSNAVQSAQSVAVPDRLELAYLRTLLFGCLLVPDPSRILVLGLGGGSVVRFLLNHFADIELVVMESRPLLRGIAAEFFGLEDDARVTFRIGDAGHLVSALLAEAPLDPGYDLILIDLCDAEGPSALLLRADFWQGMGLLLGNRGVLTVNLWTQQSNTYQGVMRLLRVIFEGGVFSLTVPGRGNVIGGVIGREVTISPQKKLVQAAQKLGIRFGLELVRMLERVEPPLKVVKRAAR
jgi:spermidine synthase